MFTIQHERFAMTNKRLLYSLTRAMSYNSNLVITDLSRVCYEQHLKNKYEPTLLSKQKRKSKLQENYHLKLLP